MDDSIRKNLVAQKETVDDLEKLVTSIQESDSNNEKDLADLKARMALIRKQTEEAGIIVPPIQPPLPTPEIITSATPQQLTYEEITQRNLDYLAQRGLLDKEFDALFTREELSRIERELSEPIKREKWDKWDFVAVLTGGVAGVVADCLTDSVNDKLMAKLGQSQKLKTWASQTKGLSIDYQGPGFGGSIHEGWSSGHDILRPFKAIAQIKNGTFAGLKQNAQGGFDWIATSANQFGKPYDTHTWWESFLLWIKHMPSDSANPTGLPYPGMSYLMNMPDHEIRKFAMGLYTHGYTLQYILAQALAPALVELIVRGYVFGREFVETGEIKFPSANKLKVTEMLLSSHAIVTAINVGKVAVRCNAEGPLALRKLNVPSIIMTVRYFVPFVVKRMKLNDPVEILKRNAKEIIEGYDSMILQISDDIKKDDDFRRFLENGEEIVV